MFKGSGGSCIAGRIETGMLQNGDKVLVQPSGEIATVKSEFYFNCHFIETLNMSSVFTLFQM